MFPINGFNHPLVGFLSPDNGGTEGGVKTIEYFMYVRNCGTCSKSQVLKPYNLKANNGG